MNTNELIQEISAKDVNIERFSQMAIEDELIRDEVIRLMMCHAHIMVYYHCYYVVSKASMERPELFYPYWSEIVSLLKHKNSYRRDFALTILANLTQVDQENLFATIFRDYFAHLNDEKLMTAQCCIQNSSKILKNKPELTDRIVALLLDVDHRCTYTEKQKAVLKSDILTVLDRVYPHLRDTAGVTAFIRAGIGSVSPKTRRTAKALLAKYSL